MNILFLLGKMPTGKAPLPRSLVDMTYAEIFKELKKVYPNYEISEEKFEIWYNILLYNDKFGCQILFNELTNEWLFSGSKKRQEGINLVYINTFEEIIQLINDN